MFYFTEVTSDGVKSLRDHTDHEKWSGYDYNAPKLIKEASDEFTLSVTFLINKSIKLGHFQNLHYHSKVLTAYLRAIKYFSMLFERVYHNQWYAYFHRTLLMISAFLKCYSCDHVFIKLEDCKQAQDFREHKGFTLMDLTKAFDCL